MRKTLFAATCAAAMFVTGPLRADASSIGLNTGAVQTAKSHGVTAQLPCTCRYRGRDIALGRTICMAGPNGLKRATCTRVLNNTSWRISREPCLPTS